MGSSAIEFATDAEGNKYLNFDESSQYDDSKNGKKLIDYEILQIMNPDDDEDDEEENENESENIVAKVRSLNNNKIYAMKKIKATNNQNNNIDLHIDKVMNMLKKLNNPHIIKYYNYFKKDDNYYIIMEFMNNSDIIGFIQAHKILNEIISEEEIWNILLQCLSALDYLYSQNTENIGLKLTHIFMNNEQNIKIGVFSEEVCREGNMNQKEDIYTLGKFFYAMMNSQTFDCKEIKQKDFISKLNYDKVENDIYSKELQDIVNNMSTHNILDDVNVKNLYEKVKKEYVIKYAKNSSIEAVLRCLVSYKSLNNRISEKKDLFKQNPEKYYINFWYYKAICYIFGFEEGDLNICIEEFRRAIASSYSKLDGNREIDPLLLLTFLLVRMHRETNIVEEKETNNGENKKPNSYYVISSSFEGEEEDKTNKPQMWNKFITKFNATTNSPISDLFFGFVKRKDLCQTCRSGYYSFYNYLYIVFDLSNRKSQNNFNLMIDGFQAQHKNCTVIDSDGAGDMLCDRCSSLHQKYKEFNRYYMLKNNLIICFIRGNHYKNQSKIIFDENINLKDYIEPDINSPHNFELVGTVIRSNKDNKEKFLSFSKDPENPYVWHLSNAGIEISNKEINYPPLDDIKKEEETGQIIMLFYKSDETG